MLYIQPGAGDSGIEMPQKTDQHDAMENQSNKVLRHRLTERLFHWTMATCMLVLLATGLMPIFGLKFDWVAPH